MLSSSSSHKLLSLLNQALHGCKDEEKQLEEQLRHYHKLLGDWKSDGGEAFNQDESPCEPQESPPSPKEVEEVELLNKALAKALKVRGSIQTESPTPPTTQTIPASSTTKEKTVKPLQKIVNTGTKPKTYQMKPPYKTMPEKRRVRGSARPALTNTTRAPPLQPLTSEKRNVATDRPTENKAVPIRADNTPGNSRPSTAPETEYVGSKSAENVKSSKQDQVRQPKDLTLKDVRPTLKLPVEFQKRYKKNSRLWEKYFEIQSRVPASRPSFIQQLQTTFIPESPELSLFEIEEETARLQRAVKRFEEYLDSAKTQQGSGPAHWQHYRSLLMLEAMQDEVAKSHCEVQKLELVAEQYKKWCKKLSIDIDSSEVAGCPPELCALPPVLVYSHPDELRELTSTHLRVRELQQKIHLQKVLSEELLAVAESQCRSSSPSFVLLRAIYTQLCEGGDTFPVLVHDDV
ncbi:tubulin epsilon and delta complex protein 2 [Rana temporaria]|uniref:tubulin epsilon and delta complex protein 2 n=1 Tax=Rana temporaria TaxID=8407 RepID=UPI001AACA02C|nr:tubulin epsilon and delta complex protein 2 [Rana temporaria]